MLVFSRIHPKINIYIHTCLIYNVLVTLPVVFYLSLTTPWRTALNHVPFLR